MCIGHPALGEDWPTHLYDNQRSGATSELLQLPLQEVWVRRPAKPAPAWPLPAKQDYWNRKTNLQPRVVHDRANGIVVANKRLIVGSSSDDQVRAYNTATGERLWNFTTEGPVRLAPTIWNDLVVFGCDDGYVYGVDLQSGDLQWKTRPPEVGTRRIPGNGRIISERPIRSGVMVTKDGTGYFAAGIFPKQGAYFFSIDVKDGSLLDHSRIEKSVQGYLEIRAGRVFAPTGRDPKGAILSEGKSAEKPGQRANLPRNTYAQIADREHIYLGRDDQVVATTRTGREVWKASVRGQVYAMAISNGQLFVSTDAGWIHCFGIGPIDSASELAASNSSTIPARDIAQERHGYALYINPDFAELVQRASSSSLQTVVALDDAERVAALRNQLAKANQYGKVVVHHVADVQQLPYGDDLFRQIIGGSRKDVERHLRPLGGIAECDDETFSRDDVTIASTTARDDWTHTYGNAGNTTSTNAELGGELQLQWFGGPGPRKMVDRHMRTMPPLVRDGVMFLPGHDRVIAVDAWSGATLWERTVPGSTRIGILKDCGWMVASTQGLLLAHGNRCEVYSADTGNLNTSVRLKVPFANREWGYLANVDQIVVGSSTLQGASRRTVNRGAILEGAYSDNRPVVCSDGMFAFTLETPVSQSVGSDTDANARTTTPIWKYSSKGAILNPSIAANGKSIFFLECQSPLADTIGRMPLTKFLEAGASLVALDLRTGQQRWRTPISAIKGAQNAYVLCNDTHVSVVNSRNNKTVHYDVHVFATETGKKLWTKTQDNLRSPGGDHGEQDKHPLLTGTRLVVEPYAYDLETGHKLSEFDLGKRGYGCGTISASLDALFFRSGTPARYSLSSNKIDHVTTVSRTGCWINMIPAANMLLIPEGSSGCTCAYPIQASMAFSRKPTK